MKDKQFLLWLHARLINRYGEYESTDFVQKLKAIADSMDNKAETKW